MTQVKSLSSTLEVLRSNPSSAHTHTHTHTHTKPLPQKKSWLWSLWFFLVIRYSWDFIYFISAWKKYEFFPLIRIQFTPHRLCWAHFSFLHFPQRKQTFENTTQVKEPTQMSAVVGEDQLEFDCSWKRGPFTQLWFLYGSVFWGHFFWDSLTLIPVLFCWCVSPMCSSQRAYLSFN
jgi:hypothetical protein